MVRFLVLLFVFVSVVSAKYTLQEQNAMLDEFLEAVKMPRMRKIIFVYFVFLI